jgi:hypothetical protein
MMKENGHSALFLKDHSEGGQEPTRPEKGEVEVGSFFLN